MSVRYERRKMIFCPLLLSAFQCLPPLFAHTSSQAFQGSIW
jgi:hypothetical protein